MKRILSLLLCLLLLLPTAAFSQNELPQKEEVVYAKMIPGGPVTEVLIVNAFLGQGSEITDYGDYMSVQNLTDSQELQVENGEVRVRTEAEDFYYQGKLFVPQMPWFLTFEYELDGRKMSPEQLKGQSGDLRIRVHVRQNPAADPVFFENYMLQISVNLDQEYFSDIASEGATIASAGETKVVNLTSLPGKEGSFVIDAKAKNAHLGQIQVVGLPFELFMELPDISEYTGDLIALQNAIAALAGGVGQYVDGARQLGEAAGELSEGAGELSRSIVAIDNGFRQLREGHKRFDTGLKEYSRGMQEFKTGMDQLLGGIGQFTQGIDQLKEGSALLAGGLQTYSEGMREFSGGLSQSALGSAQLTEGIEQLSDGLGELTYRGKYAQPSLVSGSQQFLTAFEMMDAMLDFPLTQEEAEMMIGILQIFSESFNAFVQNVEATDFDTFIALLRDSLSRFDQTVGEIEAVADALSSEAIRSAIDYDGTSNTHLEAALLYVENQRQALYDASAELRSIRAALGGLDPLIQGIIDSLETMKAQYDVIRGLISRLNDAVQAVDPESLLELKGQLQLLSNGYRQFHEGLVEYVDGVESAYLGVSGEPGLLSGSRKLTDGLDQLAEGGGKLADGAGELASGARQLDEGIGALQEGAGEFSAESGRIAEGVSQLTEGSEQLADSHGQIMEGVDALGDGLSQYADGMGEYYAGIQRFGEGASELSSRGSQLSGGANQLRDATSGMDAQMKEKMEELMGDYLPGDYTLVSFADARNTGIQRVQFIYLSEAQEAEETESPAAQEAPPRTLWEKFLDLFR